MFRRLRWCIIGIVLGIIVSLVAIVGVAYLTAPQWYRVLFIGSDQRGAERARSDVMVVLNIPRDAKKAPVLLSVPRDTRVDDAEYGLQKMTHFYAFGERPDEEKLLGNIDLTKRHIEELLDLPIDATIEVSFQSFTEIVNSLGTVCVESNCDTDGEEALKIIRDRFSEGRSDFSRQSDERDVISSIISQLQSRVAITKVTDIFNTSKTARLYYDQPKFLHFMLGYMIDHKGKISFQEYQSLSVPGSSDMVFTESFGKKLYYWIPDTQKLSEIVNTQLN
ncbi:MAG: LCP family protein [Candidatus Kerfeldbacteria bacterium]|nr:LCP family protein [Candidatus Kerfeldbacteria bacterium]